MDLFGLKRRKEERLEKEDQIRRIKLAIEFKKIFGFELPQILLKDVGWLQPAVDKYLTEAALSFQSACNNQQTINKLPFNEQGSVEKYAKELMAVKIIVEQEKEKFWKAHRIASRAGFHVKERYTEYLK
jgi:hypothetical protein